MSRRLHLKYPGTRHRPGPIETTRMPRVRCEQCGAVLVIPRDESASTVITDHFQVRHGTGRAK
jgi:hypothetical protein